MPNTSFRKLRAACCVLTVAGAAACHGVLDVDNPNNVNAEALDNPASAPNQVNGVLAALTRGAVELVGHVDAASDEMTWTGSLDGMDRLNRGFVRDPFNEFLNDATTGMSTARFMANRTVTQLETFKAANSLSSAQTDNNFYEASDAFGLPIPRRFTFSVRAAF